MKHFCRHIFIILMLITVNAVKAQTIPDLGGAKFFGVLSGGTISAIDTIVVTGNAGATTSVGSKIKATTIYQGGTTVSTALSNLSSAKAAFTAQTGTSISGVLNGQSRTSGVFTITGNASLNDTLFLTGDTSAVFIFNISGNLTIDTNAVLFESAGSALKAKQIFWNVGGTTTINKAAQFSGVVLSAGNITANGVFLARLCLLSQQNVSFVGMQSTAPGYGYSGYEVLSYANLLANGNRSGVCVDPSVLTCGQLATNGDFEVYDNTNGCPVNFNRGGDFRACSWDATSLANFQPSSPDLFNSCGTNNSEVDVPLNVYGWQYPYSGGSGYAGIYSGDDFLDKREGIQQDVVGGNLTAGRVYYFEMYASLAETSTMAGTMGVTFRQTNNVFSQSYFHPTTIDDKVGWTKISNCFIANGDEGRMVVSAQGSSLPLSYVLSGPGTFVNTGVLAFNYAYYYIDKISLKLLADAGLDKTICGLSGTVGNGCAALSGATYAWSLKPGSTGSASFAPADSPNPTATFTTTGIKTLILTVTYNGCTATDEVNINVTANPTVTASANPATICAGGSSTLTATGTGVTTYTWNPGNFTGSSYTVTPSATTTYTVTGATNGCSATATTTVTVQNVVSLTMTASSQAVLNQTDITFTLTVCNTSNQSQNIALVDNLPANMTVINANGFTVSGLQLSRNVTIAANTCVAYTFVARPSLTFSGATQCAYQSAQRLNLASAQPTGCNAASAALLFTVFSHRVVGSNVANLPSGVSLASAMLAVAQGMLLPMTGTNNATNTTQTVTVDGNFSIDQNYQFTKTTGSGNYSNIYCKGGSEITVATGITFTVNFTFVQGCDQLWKGINVVGQFLFFPGGTLNMTSSYVRDAQYGVKVAHGSTIGIAGVEFDRCFVGLYFAGGTGTSPTLTLSSSFNGNSFVCNGTMLSPYTGMANAANQPSASVVNTTRKTWTGLHLDNLSAMTLSASPINNWFTGIANGIIAYKCDLTVNKPLFQNIQPYGYTTPNQQGVGIYCGNEIGGSTPVRSLTVIGWGNNVSTPTFAAGNYYGIYASKVNVSVSNVYMNTVSNTGIYVTGAKNRNISITNNTITNPTSQGIALVQNDPENSVDVSNNTITTSGNGSYGINVYEQNLPATVGVNIHHNKVTTTGMGGINITSCKGNAGSPNTFRVYNNTVSIGWNNGIAGISYSDCQLIESNSNYVYSSSPSSQNPIFTGYPNGIQYSTTEGRFNCDSVRNIYNGIKLYGTCYNSELRGCTMNNHTYGLFVSNGATMKPQGSSTESYGNRWRGTYTSGNSARNEQSGLTQFYVKSNALSTVYWPTFSGGTMQPSSGWFNAQLNANNSTVCGSLVGAGFKTDEDENNLNALDEQVLNDSLHFTEFEEPLKWQNEKALYEKLKDNTDLIETGSEVEVFFEAKQNSPTGELSNIEAAKTQALEPEIAEADNLSQLLSIKEQLTAQLIAADTLVDSTATQHEIDSWQTVTSGISQSIAVVNTQLALLYQTIDVARLQQVEQVKNANANTAVNVQIEDNLKLLNDIYLSTVALDVDTFTADQLADLYYLAFQCPLSGGQAVYRARSLLALVLDTFYNDREICAAAGIAYKKEQEATSILKDTTMSFDRIRISTLPNPANAYLLLQSNIASDETFTLKVYDNMGRTIKEERVSLATKRFKLDTQGFPSGLYFLKLFNSSQAMYSTKFNIQH